MVNAILVRDNADVALGDFFENCHNQTKAIVESVGDVSVDEMESTHIDTDIVINMKINSLHPYPFLFISYTHGNETALLKDGRMPFIAVGQNHQLLKNACVYCYACKAGKELGRAIIHAGGKCFVGYNDSVEVHLRQPEIFAECATHFIRSFSANNNVIQSAQEMKAKYTEHIDNIYKTNALSAASLVKNRDAIVIHGDNGLSLNDFRTTPNSF